MKPGESAWGAVRWAFALTFGRRAFSTIFTFVLAALLGPHDFGLVAMALIYITLLSLVMEQGVSTALVQRADTEPEHWDSAFWLNVVWCLLLTGVGIATSGLWANLNGEPELKPVVQVLSLLVIAEGLHMVQEAVLQRELRFKRLAIRSNVAAVLGGVTGLVLALNGAGVWALVAQQLVIEFSSVVLIWALSDWRPRLRFSMRHARELLPFSSGVFLSNLGGFLGQRADALLMGIFFGPTAVGIYRLADRFVEVLLEATLRPIGLVSLPVLSRFQGDREGLRKQVDSWLRATLVLTVPALLVLAVCSDELVQVLGDEWEPAKDVLKLLAIAGIAKAAIFFAGPVLFAVSRSHVRALMQWSIAALAAATVVAVGLLLTHASLNAQVLGMATSRVLLLLLIVAPISLVVISRVTGYRLRNLLPALPGPLLSGVAALAAVTALRSTGLLDNVAPGFALVLSVGVACAAAGPTLVLVDPRLRARGFAGWRRIARGVPSGDTPLRPIPPKVTE